MSNLPKLEFINKFSEWMFVINDIIDEVNGANSYAEPNKLVRYNASGALTLSTIGINSFKIGSTGPVITKIETDFSTIDDHTFVTSNAIYNLITNANGTAPPLPITSSTITFANDPSGIVANSITNNFSTISSNSLVTSQAVYDLLTGNTSVILPIKPNSLQFSNYPVVNTIATSITSPNINHNTLATTKAVFDLFAGVDGDTGTLEANSIFLENGATINNISYDFSVINDNSVATLRAIYNLLTDGVIHIDSIFNSIELEHGEVVNNIANNFSTIDNNTVPTTNAVYNLLVDGNIDLNTIFKSLKLENGISVNTISKDFLTGINDYTLVTSNAIFNLLTGAGGNTNPLPVIANTLSFGNNTNVVINNIITSAPSANQINDNTLVTSNSIYQYLTGNTSLDLNLKVDSFGFKGSNVVINSISTDFSTIDNNTVPTTNAVYNLLTDGVIHIDSILTSVQLKNGENVNTISNNFSTIDNNTVPTTNAVYNLLVDGNVDLNANLSSIILSSGATVNSIATDFSVINHNTLVTSRGIHTFLSGGGGGGTSIDASFRSLSLESGVTVNALANDFNTINNRTLITTKGVYDLLTTSTVDIDAVLKSLTLNGTQTVNAIVNDFTSMNNMTLVTSSGIYDYLTGASLVTLPLKPTSLQFGSGPTITGIATTMPSPVNDVTLLTAGAIVNYVTGKISDLIDGANSAYDTLKEIEYELKNNDSDIATIFTNLNNYAIKPSANSAIGQYLKWDGVANTFYNSTISGSDHTHSTYALLAGSLSQNFSVNNLTAAGDVSASGDVIAAASDDRLKTRVGNLDSVLDAVSKLDVFYYEPNKLGKSLGFADRRDIGVSAQQINEIVPELIHLSPLDDDGTGESKSGENYLTVNYAKLTTVLLACVKELKQEIDELKNKK